MTELRDPDGRAVSTTRVTVAAHQPGYHRHLYYYAKMAAADVFVSLDTVQYVTREWQNRQVFWHAGRRGWLTVPVVRGREPLARKIITEPAQVRNHWRVLTQIYDATPYFHQYADELAGVYESGATRLVDLCDALDDVVTRALGITTARYRASHVLPDTGATRGRLLAELALAAGRRARPGAAIGYLACAAPMRADHYLRRTREPEGPTELDVMRETSVDVLTFAYRHPVYRQHQLPPGHPFEAELSAFDLMFNHGPAARQILERAALG